MGQTRLRSDWLELGVRLRTRRSDLNLTRAALADVTQISPRRLGAFERGAAAISAVELHRVAGALRTSMGRFFTEPYSGAPGPGVVSLYEALATSDEGAALAAAFVRLKTPRLRRHLARLAQELVDQEQQAAT